MVRGWWPHDAAPGRSRGMTSTVALTGATGALGGRVATRLAATAQEDDAALWVLVRDAGARG